MGNSLVHMDCHSTIKGNNDVGDDKYKVDDMKYKKINGCFILKVKKLKVPEESLLRIRNCHPNVKISELQLMLCFRGR